MVNPKITHENVAGSFGLGPLIFSGGYDSVNQLILKKNTQYAFVYTSGQIPSIPPIPPTNAASLMIYWFEHFWGK